MNNKLQYWIELIRVKLLYKSYNKEKFTAVIGPICLLYCMNFIKQLQQTHMNGSVEFVITKFDFNLKLLLKKAFAF